MRGLVSALALWTATCPAVALPAEPTAAEEPVFTGEPVTLELLDVPLPQAFLELAAPQGVNILIGPGAHGPRVDLRVRDEPWDSASTRLLKEHGLEVDLRGSVLLFGAGLVQGDFDGCDLRAGVVLVEEGVAHPEVECGAERALGPRGSVDLVSVPGVLLWKGPAHRVAELERWLDENGLRDESASPSDPRHEALARFREESSRKASAEREATAEAERQRRERDAARAWVLREADPRTEGRLRVSRTGPRARVWPKALDDVAFASLEVLDDEAFAALEEPAPVLVPLKPGDSAEAGGLPIRDRCFWPTAPAPVLEFRARRAKDLLADLPAASCAIDATPEAVGILEDSLLSGRLQVAWWEVLEALAAVTGLSVDFADGRARFFVSEG